MSPSGAPSSGTRLRSAGRGDDRAALRARETPSRLTRSRGRRSDVDPDVRGPLDHRAGSANLLADDDRLGRSSADPLGAANGDASAILDGLALGRREGHESLLECAHETGHPGATRRPTASRGGLVARRACGVSVRWRDERGMATAELVLLTPVALVVLAFLVIAGRLSTTTADVAAAARDAARAASLTQTYEQAVDAATTTAGASLAAHDVTCRNLTVTGGDPSTFVAGGEITITVSCDVSLADVALPGIPGTRSIAKASTEVIDRFRGVGG